MPLLPTRRAAMVAALAAVALALYPGTYRGSAWLPIGVGALLIAVLVVGDGLAAVRPAQLKVRRIHAPSMVMGDRGPLAFEVHNPTRVSVLVHIADELAPSLRAAAPRVTVRVPARGRARASTTLAPARRGHFHLRHLGVRVEGPLGLGARQSRVAVATELAVFPPFRSRQEAEIATTRALEVGLRSARGRGSGTEFDQLREYTSDDEFRRIDWRATARAGKPIVRTYRAERNQNVVVLLDNGRIMAGRVADVPRVEHAMDATMMLTAVATRLGDRVGLVTFDTQVRRVVPPARRTDQVMRLTEAMYALDPVLAESDYAGAFATTVARFRRRALFVIFTDLVEQAVGESLLPALPLICRRHLVVVAAVRDPEVVTWSTSVPVLPEGAFRKAGAVSGVAERDRTRARLQGMGVSVVDAAPGRLARAVTDTYLNLKSTGRL